MKKFKIFFHYELGTEKLQELAVVQSKLTKFLNKELASEKEYVICFADAPHFLHIHFHIIAIPKDLPKRFRGANIYALTKIDERESLPKKDIIELCNRIKTRFSNK